MYAPYGLPPEVGEILRAKDEEIRRLDKQIEMMATMRQEIYELKREQSQLSAGSSRPSFFDHHRASTSFHGQLPPSGFISLPQWPDSEEALRRGDRDRKRSRSRERRTERRESRDRGRHRESRRTRSRSRDRETWKESRRSRSRSRDPRSTTVYSFLSRRSPESSRDRSPQRRPVLSPRRERSRDKDSDRKREESSKRTEMVCSSSSSRRREEEKRRKEKRGEDPKSSKASSEPKKSCNSTTSRQRGDDKKKEEIKSSSTHHSSSSKKLSTSTKPSSSSFTKASSSSSSSWRNEEDRRKEESTKSSFASSSKTTKHPSSFSSSRDWTKDSRESEKRKEKKAEEEPEIDLEMLEEVDDDYDYFDTVSEHEVLERIPTPDDGLSAYERMQRKLLAIPNDLDEYLTDEEKEAQDTIETFSESAPVEDSTTKIQIAQNLGKVEKKKAARQAAEIAKRLKSGQKLSKNQKRAIRVGSLQITVGGEPGRQVKVLGPETTDTKEKDTVRKTTVINKNTAAKTTIGEGPEMESPVSTKYPAKKTTVPYPPIDSSVVLGEVTETPTLSKRQQRRKRKEANVPTTVPKKMALPTVSKKNPLVIDLTSGHRVEKVTPAPTVSSVQAKSTVSSGLDSTPTSSGLVTRSIVSGSPEKTTTVSSSQPTKSTSVPSKTTVSSSNSSGPETKSTVWRKETGLQPTVISTLHRKPIPSLMDVPVHTLWGSFPAPTSHFVSTSTNSNLIPSFCDSPHFSGTYFEPSPPVQAYSTPVPSYNHPYFSQPAPVPQPMAYSVPPPMQMPFPSYGQPVQETVNPPVPGMSTSSRADLARQAESFLKTIQNRDGLVESDLEKGIEEKKMISTQGTVDLTTHVTLDKSGAPVPRLTAQILGGSGGQLVQKRRKTEINPDEDEYDMIFK